MTNYYINTAITLTATITDANGVAHDPTAVSLTTTDPTGTQVTYSTGALTLTHSGTGIYTVSVTPGVVGVWTYSASSTGTYVAASVNHFRALALT